MRKILLFAAFILMSATAYGQTLLSEDFQSGALPASWTVMNTNTETWHVEDPLLGTDYKATVNYDAALGAQNEMLVTPSLDLTTGVSYSLKLKVGLSYYWAVDPNNNYDAFIKVSTDNGVTWTQIWSENDLGVFTNWTMNPVTLNLTPYIGNANVKIAFQYVGTDGAALYVDDVIVAAGPTTLPDCATPSSPANAAVGISYPATPLSWNAPSSGSSVDSYDVFLDQNPNPTTLIGNTSALTLNATGLLPSTTYYWKVIAKNALGSATGCMTYSFTTAANPFAPYCGPLKFSTTVEPITKVTFGGIDNASSAATSGGIAHEDYTSIVGNVTQGGTYEVSLEGNTNGNWTNRFAVFIDWNQNGILNDSGEVYEITQLLVNSTGADGKKSVQNLVVPVGATLGNTRMRVKKIFGTTDYLNPCLGASFGQAEDYTLNVTSLAVNDATRNAIKVYPNPAVDYINIESPAKVKSVAIYDASGKSVSTYELNTSKSQINLSKLNPGVYMVKINLDNEVRTVKVIKK